MAAPVSRTNRCRRRGTCALPQTLAEPLRNASACSAAAKDSQGPIYIGCPVQAGR
jgi:hypothetical protein